MYRSKFFNVFASLAITALCCGSAMADDTEVFFGTTSNSSSGYNPNVLLVLDTSGSMDTQVSASSTKDYDPAATYTSSSGTCSSNDIYWVKAGGNTPTCNSNNKINKNNFFCRPATDSTTGSFSSSGQYLGNAISWETNGNNANKYKWSDSISNNAVYITCQNDDTTVSDNQYPRSGKNHTASQQWGGTQPNNYYTPGNNPNYTAYTFYNAHYVTYLSDSSQTIAGATRLSEVQKASKELIGSLSGVNVGIMRYDTSGEGGMVVAQMQDVTIGKTTLQNAITSMTASGVTPLSETLYEAYRYFSGGTVKYGATSTPSVSVDGSRTGNSTSSTTYATPIINSCQNNYIVYLTDGLANGDSSADSLIEGLDPAASGATNATSPGCYTGDSVMWSALGQSVPSDTHSGGLCLKELSRYMFNNDVLTATTEEETVRSYFIGFGDQVAAGAPQAYLQDAAEAGGGKAESATNALTLATAFKKTLGSVLETSSSFTSPSIAVNAFNKTQVLEDLYVAMFKPSNNTHWDGNLKKFKLRDGQIVGNNYLNAINPTSGFIDKNAEDFWQQTGDTGTETTTKGGAANMIPATTSRKLYTYIGSNQPGAKQALSGHPFSTDASNYSAIEALLGTSSASGCGSSSPCTNTLINWARGDKDGNTDNTTDVRHIMGDPVHSQPAVVIYGNDSTASTDTQKLNDALVFVASNDGYLHAIDVTDGHERWAYIPQEILSDLLNLYNDNTVSEKHYSLDGDIRVMKYDVDGDGVVEPANGDRVYLYFSQGRGGPNYYALDVTDKDDPKFVWSLGTSDLPKVSKSWSTPTLGRINIKDAIPAQNPQKLVLIFGGGYDVSEDAQGYVSADASGNAIYIVDAIKGTVLWSKTKTNDSTAFDLMTHAIPSNITVLDTNADGFSDRMYFGDLAGQIWRLDITNGNDKTTLVAGGVIASLGEKGQSTPTVGDIANNRSFYSQPDVSKFVVSGGANYYNIAIGSGDRAYPKSNITTSDYLFAIRDYYLGAMSQSVYNGLTPIKITDLTSVTGTTVTPIGGQGWKLPLSSTEKALARSVTVDGVVMFTTFIPSSGATNSCVPIAGSGRAYTISLSTGYKYFDDLYQEFKTTGLPTQVSIVNEDSVVRTDGTTPDDDDTGGGLSSSSTPGTCLSGVTILGNCVDFGSKVRTFWQEAGAN